MMKLLAVTILFAQMISTGNHRAIFAPSGPTPPTTNLIAWYKADSLSASPVPSWTDSSGNSHTMSQGTAPNQPTWSAAQINGLPALGMNGSSQDLGTLSTIPYAGSISIYVVWKAADVSGNDAFTSNSNSGGTAFEYRLASGQQQALLQNTALLGTGTATVTVNTWYKSAVTYNSTSGAVTFYLNGVADGTATNVQSVPDGIDTLFSNSGTSEYFDGQVAEILVYSTSTYQSAVDSYLFARYGL